MIDVRDELAVDSRCLDRSLRDELRRLADSRGAHIDHLAQIACKLGAVRGA